jgi:uncharacterized protein (TIGR02996 family)
LDEAEKLCKAHLAKGYSEKIEAPPPPDGFERLKWVNEQVARAKAGTLAPQNPALEDACHAAPDDPAPWQVFADWLSEQGDARGDVALGAMRGMGADVRSVLRQTIPNVIAFDTIDGVGIDELNLGFLVRASASLSPATETPEILEGLVRSPLAASLRELKIGLGYPAGDWTPALEVLCESPLAPRLRRLVFDASNHLPKTAYQYGQAVERELKEIEAEAGVEDDDDSYGPDDAHVQRAQEIVGAYVGEVCPVRFAATASWSALTALESLVIEGPFRGDLGQLELPKLRELVIRSDRLRFVTGVVNARCPRLERLELWCGPEDTTDLSPLAADGVLPELRELALFDLDESLIEPIRKSDLGSRVKLVTEIPNGAELSRYADPADRGINTELPRGGEPPPPPKKKKKR